jgi:hypothetical protein
VTQTEEINVQIWNLIFDTVQKINKNYKYLKEEINTLKWVQIKNIKNVI